MKSTRRKTYFIYTKKISHFYLYILLLFLVININVLFSQTFKPFQKLYVIKTEKFEIIYSDKTRETAVRLSKIADNIYKKYSKMINKDVRGVITVTLTSDNRIMNAYAYPVSRAHIVMYIAPEDINWTAFENSLESTFLHELMHLLTLASTDTFFTRVFGPWLSLGYLSGSYFMTEGVTVSYESLSGYGRANDPFVKQTLREDIRENKFKTPIQVSDVWDKYPYMNVIYEYGGLFSKYIQDKYGMEKYAAFWERIQKRWHLSFNFYNTGLYNAFKKIYGITFLEAWADFKNSLTITNVVRNENGLITKKPSLIGDIKTHSNYVYFIDGNYANLNVYNTKTKKTKKIKGIPKSSDSLALNKTADKILIGYNHYKASFGTPYIREYDLKEKRYTKLKIKDAKEAAYFRDGIVYIASDIDRNYLEYLHSGKTEKLLHPEYDIFYSSPAVIDENKIAFIMAEKGIRMLAVYDYEKKSVTKIKTDLPNDKEIWRYMRSLSYSDGKLLFAYNDNDEFYKLGILDLQNKTLLLTKTNYMGGIIKPALSENEIYYKGMFTDYQALMVYPEKLENINGEKTLFTEETLREFTDITNKDTSYLLGNIKEKRYAGIKYINPLKMWFPFPLFAEGSPYFFTGVGLFTFFTDAIDHNNVLLFAAYDAVSIFADLDIRWQNFSLMYPLEISFKDKIVYTASIRYRKTSLTAVYSPYFDIDGKSSFSLSPIVSAMFLFYNRNYVIGKDNKRYLIDDYSKSAYTWKYQSYSINIAFDMNYTYLNKTLKPMFYDYLSINILPMYSPNHNKYRVDSSVSARSKYMPFNVKASFEYSDSIIDYDGGSEYFSLGIAKMHPEYYGYAKKYGVRDNKLFSSEIEAFYPIEIDANVSYLYINRIYGALSYRNSAYGGKYFNSLALKIGLITHIPISFSIPVNFEFTAALALPPNTLGGKNYFAYDNWYFGFTVSSSLISSYI